MSSVNLKRKKAINAEMNQVLDDFDRFEYFFATHWKKFVWGALTFVGALAVFFSVEAWNEHTATKAAATLDQAQTEPELIAALKSYPTAAAATAARLRLATLQLNSKQLDAAAATLLDAEKNCSDMAQLARIKLTQAYVNELQQKFEAAAAQFAQIGANNDAPAVIRAEAYANAARLQLQLKQTDAARNTLAAAKLFAEGSRAQGGSSDAGVQAWYIQCNALSAKLAAQPAAQ